MKINFLRSVAFIAVAALVLGGCPMTEDDVTTPPPAPEILDPEPEGSSIKVKWTPLSQATGYEVYYTGGGSLPGTDPVPVEGGDAGFALIPDLETDTTYYVWVKALNSVGVSRDSAVKTCVTNKAGKTITTFAVGETQGIINGTDISLLAPFATNLAQVTPSITLSPDATVNPASGSAVDFSGGPVTFTVTAQNGTTQAYTVTVTKRGKAPITLLWADGQGFVDPGTGAFEDQDDPVLSKTDPDSDTAEINLQGSFTAYEWYVDNSLKGSETLHEDDTPEISLDAHDYFVGSHRLDIIVHDATGVPYSKGLRFEVEE